jgi:acetolactate synthase-1/2/3 large subunit
MIDRNADVFPMVGPGQSYSNMITGPFIPSRSAPQADGLDATTRIATDMF